jgi:hypothetical protein
MCAGKFSEKEQEVSQLSKTLQEVKTVGDYTFSAKFATASMESSQVRSWFYSTTIFITLQSL